MNGRYLHMVALALATLADDTGPLLRLQVNEGRINDGDRIIDGVAMMQHFGFASVPPLGSRILMVRQAGDRSQSIGVASNHNDTRLRNLQPGDSGIYDVRGATITLTADGLTIDCAGLPAVLRNCPTVRLVATEKVTIDAPTTEILHDATVGGNMDVAGTLTADGTPIELGALRDAYNAHAHSGVQTGSGTSGGTDHPT